MVYPNYKKVTDPEVRKYFEDFWGAELDPNEGLTVVEITEAIHAGQITGMYIMGENPAMSDPDSGHVREALAKLDHLVVQDIFLTETASYADVILPASAWTEKTGTVTNTDRRVQIGRPITDPPGEARQDLWIINAMANGLGLDWAYAHPKEVYAEMYECMPSLKNITWERLEKEGAVTYPCPDPDGPGKTVLFGEGFPTPSTRGRMVPCDVLPADEIPDEQYPMILTTGRLLEHWHTGAMTRRSKTLAAIEPVATAHMHPNDLEKMGLGPGDRVRVATRRGEIELPAGEYEDVPEGVIFIPFFDHDAAANILTNPALDPYGKIAEVKFCAARVEGV